MDMLKRKARVLLQTEESGSHFIHGLRAQTAKGRYDHRALIQAQLFSGLFFSGKDKFPLYGHSNHFHLLRVAIVPGTFRETDQNLINPVRNQAGCKTRHSVTLMDTGGNFHHRSRHQCGEAGITARTHHHIRLKFPDDPLTGPDGSHQIGQHFSVMHQRFQGFPPGRAVRRQRFKLVSGLRNQLLLHPADATNKQNIGIGIALPAHIGYSNRRIDMPGSTAAAKNYIHWKSSCRVARFRQREMLSKIPISPRFTASAVPP